MSFVPASPIASPAAAFQRNEGARASSDAGGSHASFAQKLSETLGEQPVAQNPARQTSTSANAANPAQTAVSDTQAQSLDETDLQTQPAAVIAGPAVATPAVSAADPVATGLAIQDENLPAADPAPGLVAVAPVQPMQIAPQTATVTDASLAGVNAPVAASPAADAPAAGETPTPRHDAPAANTPVPGATLAAEPAQAGATSSGPMPALSPAPAQIAPAMAAATPATTPPEMAATAITVASAINPTPARAVLDSSLAADESAATPVVLEAANGKPVNDLVQVAAQPTAIARSDTATETNLAPAPFAAAGDDATADTTGQTASDQASDTSAAGYKPTATGQQTTTNQPTSAEVRPQPTTGSADQGAARPIIDAARAPAAQAQDAAMRVSLEAFAPSAPVHGTTASGHAATAAAAPSVPVQVATRIIERVDGRAQRFEISLQPEELGRVDVRIEIGSDRRVHAVLAVHDSAALSDLMRGQRALERALADAGVDLADGGVKFELADDSNRGTLNQFARDGQPEQNVWRSFSERTVHVDADAAPIVRTSRHARLDLVA